MARYFFHIRSKAELVPDFEGDQFASLQAARREAIRDLREMVARQLLGDAPVQWDTAIEIFSAGEKVAEITFIEAVNL